MIHAVVKQNINYVRFPDIFVITNPTTNNNLDNKLNFLAENYNFKQGETYNISFPKKNDLTFNFIGTFIKLMLIISFAHVIYCLIRRKYFSLNILISIIIFFTLVTIAILHSFDIPRYLQTILPFILIFILISILDLVQQKEKKQFKLRMNKSDKII